MADITGKIPLQENPLRERSVILKRYGWNALAGVLLAAMTYHIFVVETDWARMGGLADILSTTAEFFPNLSFFPIIIEPLFETLLIAFWGTTDEKWFPEWEFLGRPWDPTAREIYLRNSPSTRPVSA